MSEERVMYNASSRVFAAACKSDTLDVIQVSRAELEQERRHLLGRLQQLHRLLGYPPILTGKEERRQAVAK